MPVFITILGDKNEHKKMQGKAKKVCKTGKPFIWKGQKGLKIKKIFYEAIRHWP